MKIRNKLGLTVCVLIVWAAVMRIVDLYYSPVTGTLSANTLNGSNTDYAMAKFIQDGGAGTIVMIASFLLILLIWWNPFYDKNK